MEAWDKNNSKPFIFRQIRETLSGSLRNLDESIANFKVLSEISFKSKPQEPLTLLNKIWITSREKTINWKGSSNNTNRGSRSRAAISKAFLWTLGTFPKKMKTSKGKLSNLKTPIEINLKCKSQESIVHMSQTLPTSSANFKISWEKIINWKGFFKMPSKQTSGSINKTRI